MSLLRRLIGKKGVDDLRVHLRISPKFRDLRPFRSKPLSVGVTVLDDQRVQSLRVGQDDPITDRRPVVEQVERVASDLELLEQRIDCLGKMVEGVTVHCWRRRITLSETREVRCDDVIARRQQGDQRVELPRRRREPVQQHDGGRALGARLPDRRFRPVDLGAVIGGRRRGRGDRACRRRGARKRRA